MNKLNELEKSLSILLSLYVMIEQNFDALTYYQDHFSEDSYLRKSMNIPDKKEFMIDEAITESLWFQIILKSCSFIEEWDKFLGTLTETDYKEKIHLIKKIVKPAKKAIEQWSDLKHFRNEIIAHNFRSKKREFKLYSIDSYDCPKTDGELYYLVAFLNRMIRVLSSNLPIETIKVTNSFGELIMSKRASSAPDSDISRNLFLKNTLSKVDSYIAEEIFALPRYDIVNISMQYLSYINEDEN